MSEEFRMSERVTAGDDLRAGLEALIAPGSDSRVNAVRDNRWQAAVLLADIRLLLDAHPTPSEPGRPFGESAVKAIAEALWRLDSDQAEQTVHTPQDAPTIMRYDAFARVAVGVVNDMLPGRCRHTELPDSLWSRLRAAETRCEQLSEALSNEVAISVAAEFPTPSEPEATVVEADVRPWQPRDGDTRCQDCGHTYEPWFTDNTLWNEVMGGSAYAGDPGGYLCPRCFTKRADSVFPRLIWRVIPNWNGRAEPMDWPIADGGGSR